MARRSYYIFIGMLFSCVTLFAMDEMEQLIPEKLGLWFQSGPDQVYSSLSLYDYIDGGAELFISYGFDRALSRTYIAEDQPDIKVDLFDMHLPENAFGVFCHIQENMQFEFGQGSVIYDDAILFWKDHYYVSITSDDITPASIETLRKMAQYINAAIPIEGALPEVLNYLPEKNLIEASIIYFKHYIWQNSLYYFADENILELDPYCHAVLAKFDLDKQQVVCLVVEFPDESRARRAFRNFNLAFEMSPEENPGYVPIEDHKWLGASQKESLFMALFNGDDRLSLEDLMQNINPRK